MLLIIQGDPGIGKSSFANSFAMHAGFSVLDKDDLKDIVFPDYINDFERCDEMCYKCCIQQIHRLLSNNTNTIFDDILNRKWVFDELVATAAANSHSFFVLDCYLESREEWLRRLDIKAKGKYAEHRLRTWEQVTEWQRTRRQNFHIAEDKIIKVALDGNIQSSVAYVSQRLNLKLKEEK